MLFLSKTRFPINLVLTQHFLALSYQLLKREIIIFGELKIERLCMNECNRIKGYSGIFISNTYSVMWINPSKHKV